nr:oxygenase MpaB family protein [Nocardioides yefusunii]
MSRRNMLSLGTALGLGATMAPGAAWAWDSQGSLAGNAYAGQTNDPNWIWDDEIDQIMADVIQNGQVSQTNRAMEKWVNNRDTVPTGIPDPLRGWIADNAKLPSWADKKMLTHSTDVNRRLDTHLFILYGIGGGLMSTVIPREARSVYWSKGGSDMQDRAAKTFSFGYDLAQIGAFDPGGQFLVTATKTRMVHSAVRHLLPQSPHWRAAADETIPISNADILVTYHSTGTYARTKLRSWGFLQNRKDDEAFLHSWQVALHMLGVQEQFIPESWADAEEQSRHVLTPILAPTVEGRDLAEQLLQMPRSIDAGLTRGLLNEFARYLLSDQIGDWLNLRRDYAAAALLRVAWPTYMAFRRGTIPFLPLSYYALDQFIRAFGMAFLNKGQSTQTTLITLPETNRV